MLDRLLENWSLKLVSVIFALLLWAFLMGEQRVEVGYTVPLELMNVPEGLMVASEVPSLVDVRLSGPRTRLAPLNPGDIRVTVDLKGLEAGVASFRRLEEKLTLPSGVRVVRLSPSSVELTLERIGRKMVPVKVVLSGEPSPGYSLGPVVTKPTKVTLVGAESELKGVQQVETDPVDLAGMQESFRVETSLHHAGTYTRLDPVRLVDVAVTIIPPAAKPQGETKDGSKP